MAHEDNPWAKEAEENQSRQRQSNIDNMKWKQGEHTIRIMPAKQKGALPFVKYIVHWIPIRTAKNDRPIIHEVGYRCPVCEFVGKPVMKCSDTTRNRSSRMLDSGVCWP